MSVHTHILARNHIHTRTQTHTNTHTHMRTHTHTHTHIGGCNRVGKQWVGYRCDAVVSRNGTIWAPNSSGRDKDSGAVTGEIE
jgi:hypothetical protein